MFKACWLHKTLLNSVLRLDHYIVSVKTCLKVCLYLSMPLHMHTLQDVIKNMCGCVPIEALNLILDIGQLAQHDSSAWLPWVKWELSLTSPQLIHIPNNVCVCVYAYHMLSFSSAQCIHTPSQNQYLLLSGMQMRLSMLLFVDRLQLRRHMTFRSSCFYLANPCRALTAPTEVMDDFVCTKWGLCKQMCAISQKRRKWEGGCDMRLACSRFPWEVFKKRHLKKAEQDLCRVFTLSLPISAFTLPYVMTPRDGFGCNVSAFSTLIYERHH